MMEYIKEMRLPISVLKPEKESDAVGIQTEIFLRSFFHFNENRLGIVSTSLENIIRDTGVRAPVNKIRKNKRYKVLIDALQEHIRDDSISPLKKGNFSEKSLNTNISFYNYIDEPFFKCNLHTGRYDASEPFVSLTVDEYEILISENGSSNRIRDLHVYLFIKSKMWKRHEGDDPLRNPEYAVFSLEELWEGCHIGIGALKTSLENLKNNLHLIASEKPKGKVVSSGEYYNFKTVYVLKNDNWEDELCNGIKRYTEFVNKHMI